MHWLTKSILDSKKNVKLYIAATGGGTGVISSILEQGNASDFFIGANVPYSTDSLRRFLAHNDCSAYEPYKCLTPEMAMCLALASYREIKSLPNFCETNTNIGLGITASLYKDNQREDRQNHAYVAVCLYNNWNTPMWISHIDFVDPTSRLLQETMLVREIASIIDCEVNKKIKSSYVKIRNT
jgi:hypothetical protein